MKVQKHLQHLYAHLLDNGYLQNLDTTNHEHLNIHADVVLEKIRNGENDWQSMVPEIVVNIINERGLFR